MESNHSLIPADDGVWDELNHQQSREIQQHLVDTQQTSFLHQTVESIRTAAAAVASFRYTPVDNESPNLTDFGIPNDDPLLQGFDSPGYEEFPRRPSPPASFVFLEQFRLPQRDTEWGAVSNLDLFFSSLYNFYYHRGLTPILGKGIVDLFSLFVTLWLSVILFAYVDWQELAKCTDETTCKDSFGDYMKHRPFAHFSLWNSIVILYCILFSCYGLFSLWSFWTTLQDAYRARQFFQDRLGISMSKLEGGGVDWDRDVVTKLMELQQGGEYRIAIHGQGSLHALVIAQRIMRKENFMTAFFNRGLLDLQLPYMSRTFFCKSLEWSIYFCVLNYMFNHKFQIRPAFFLDPRALQRRFMLCGVAHTIFLPFLAFFMILHFLMQNVYDWKSTKQYLGPKEWSLSAKWTFREFNELPHFFERRLGPSYEATEEYLKLFKQSEFMTTIGRILAFIGGSFGAVLLVFAAINDAILLYVKIGNFNLLWFVGIMTVCFSVGKGMLPNPQVHLRYIRNLFTESDQALEGIASHTHHYPDSWKGRGYDSKTKALITSMFNNKAMIFAHELLALLVAPIILCYSLPKCAEHICEFVMTVKAEVPGAGDLCGYSTFDFDEFSDDHFEGKTLGSDVVRGDVAATVAELHDVEAATLQHAKPRAYHGKMEKSFFSFKASHPNWTSITKSGQTLLDRVEQFKEDETRALVLEQQQHMHAAARQLETLARLEQRNHTVSPVVVARLQESYIGATRPAPVAAGADSGGGGTTTTTPLQHAAIPNVDTMSPLRQPATPETPPPFAVQDSSAVASSRLLAGSHETIAARSVMHYADMGLSTELRRILSRSGTMDPSMTASMLGATQYEQQQQQHLEALGMVDPVELQRRDEQVQYQWLQRYHAREQQQQRPQQQQQPGPADAQSAHNAENSTSDGGNMYGQVNAQSMHNDENSTDNAGNGTAGNHQGGIV